MAIADTARLIASLDLKGNFDARIRASEKALGSFDAKLDRTQSRAYRVGQNLGTGIKNIGRFGVVAASSIAAVGVASLKAAGDFEAQLNTINTIARATPEQLKNIGAGVRQIAKDTGTSLDDLTQGYYDLLSAGIKTADATGVLTAANTLAIGGLSTTAESVDLLTTALNVYGGGAAAATKDADIFAKTIERGKITAADLAASFSQVGGIAKASGISLDELGASYARLTASGTDAAEASTQIRSAIVALTKVSSPLEKLQKQTGRNYLAIAGDKGLVTALEIMRKDADKAGVPLIDLLGRVEGLNFALATTGPNFKAYNDDLAAMGNATGTAAAQMAERQKGLNFQLSILKANVKDAAISIGSDLLPKITPLAARLATFLKGSDFQKGIADFGTSLAGLFSDSNIQAGIDAIKTGFETAKTAAPVVSAAAKATFGFVQAAVGLFKSLPAPLQGLLVGGFAVNKLTGGLVTNIAGGIKDALGGILSDRLGKGGNPANPLFVFDVAGGVGALPGAAAAGGIAAAALPVAAIAAAIAGPIVAQQKISSDQQIIAYNLVTTNVQQEIASGVGDLRLSLDAVNQGINDIQANPLNMIVGGEALKELKANRAALENAIDIQFDTHSELVRIADAAQQNTADTHSEAVRTREANTSLFTNLGRALGKLNFKALPNALHRAFSADFAALLHATKANDIAKAARKVAAEISKGVGNVDTTKGVVAALTRQLSNTHDPKLAATLRAAIARVQAKIPGREYAQKQIAKADALIRDGKTTNRDLKQLQSIERALKDRGLPHAAQVIREKIEAAKRAQVAAAHGTTTAVRTKKSSFIANTYVTTTISVRDQFVKDRQVSRTQAIPV